MNDTVEVQGYEFEYVPRTQKNIEDVIEYMQENMSMSQEMQEKTQSVVEEMDELDADKINEKVRDEIDFDPEEIDDDWEMRRKVFRRALNGPHEHIDYEKLTWDELEEVRKGFIPEQMRFLDALMNF